MLKSFPTNVHILSKGFLSVFCQLFYLGLCVTSNLSKNIYDQSEVGFYMKMVGFKIITPKTLITNSISFFCFPLIKNKNKNRIFSKLVSANKTNICYGIELYSTSRHAEFKNFLKRDSLTCFYGSHYSLLSLAKYTKVVTKSISYRGNIFLSKNQPKKIVFLLLTLKEIMILSFSQITFSEVKSKYKIRISF